MIDRIFNKIADSIGTKLFFLFCLILDLLELSPVIKAHSVITWVTYLSQTVIQLLALPILAYQNKMQQANHNEIMSHIKAQNKHMGLKHFYRRKDV